MNKYKEALLYLSTHKCNDCAFEGQLYALTEQNKHQFILRELVEKATPKKPKKHITPYNYIEFECPNCNTVTHTNFIRPYCGECGQALDWGE